MKKFEIGHTYFDRYACDYETLSVIKIVKRTAKTVVFERNGETRRALLREDSNGEYIIPDHYSVACVYRADSEIVDGVPNDELDVYETAEAEEAPESLENAPVEAEKPEVGKVIYFPAQARKQPEVTGYAVADALVRYTVKQMTGVLFGGCDLRAKELDFLAALTQQAGGVVR